MAAEQETMPVAAAGEITIQVDAGTTASGVGASNTAQKPTDDGQSISTGSAENKEGKVTASQKQDKLEFNLEQAKDRAQITATTSMSIVHVALLKQMLEAGSEQKHYHFILVIVIIALALQIVAGLLALYVSLMRAYYAKYRDSILRDCMRFCIPCECRSKKKPDGDEETGCCPCVCNFHYVDAHDRSTIEIYQELVRSSAQVDKYIANALYDETAHMPRKNTVDGGHPSGADLSCDLENIKHCLAEAESIRSRWKGLWKNQAGLIEEVEEIERQTILRRATFWQSVITVMLYIVFVLNTFIVGFGLPAVSKAEE